MKNSETTSSSISGIFGEVIHEDSFNTRLQDGQYMDMIGTTCLNALASEAGIKFSVAVDTTLAGKIKDIPASQSFQSIEGRCWDLFSMFINAAKGRISAQIQQLECGQAMTYDLIMHHGRSKWMTVKAVVGPKGSSDPEPCISFHFIK